MARSAQSAAVAPSPATRAMPWLILAALVGLGFSLASTWVHYQILRDPGYSSFCDVSSAFSCTNAYTSQYGALGGVPVALLGVVYFGFVLMLIALCRSSESSRQNLPGYLFALSTIGLAMVLYLAYASFFQLATICLLCVGTYVAIIALFLISGAAARYPMSSLFGRASRDLRTLARTPAALGAAIAFVGAAVVAVVLFPGEPVVASSSAPASQAAAQPEALPPQLMELLNAPRAPIVVPNNGAAVVIVKFNDYQCPPCGNTYRQYKPILAKLEQQYPGKITFVTRDFPLELECNTLNAGHVGGCEAAVAVRLAREKGRANEMEDWLFSNQPNLSRDTVKQGLTQITGVTDFDARYAQTLELVKGEVAQGKQLGVSGTPTFFINGIKLPGLQPVYFEAAILWELRRLGAVK